MWAVTNRDAGFPSSRVLKSYREIQGVRPERSLQYEVSDSTQSVRKRRSRKWTRAVSHFSPASNRKVHLLVERSCTWLPIGSWPSFDGAVKGRPSLVRWVPEKVCFICICYPRASLAEKRSLSRHTLQRYGMIIDSESDVEGQTQHTDTGERVAFLEISDSSQLFVQCLLTHPILQFLKTYHWTYMFKGRLPSG